MRPFLLPPVLALLAVPALAWAQQTCYADYKASREQPLELQYGVAQVYGECSEPAAAEEIQPRIAVDGWTLLEVMSTFGEGGLEERRESAGEYFLRY